MITTVLKTSPTHKKGLFLTYEHVGCELAVALSHALSLFSNLDRKRGPNLGNVARQEEQWWRHGTALRPSAQKWVVYFLLPPHLQVTGQHWYHLGGQNISPSRTGTREGPLYIPSILNKQYSLSHNRCTINKHNYVQGLIIFLHIHFYEWPEKKKWEACKEMFKSHHTKWYK